MHNKLLPCLISLKTLLAMSIASDHYDHHNHDHKNGYYNRGNEDHLSGYQYGKGGDHSAEYSNHNNAASGHNSDEDHEKEHTKSHHSAANSGGEDRKHLSRYNKHGKKSKGKSYGFFNYRWIQPQYHIEEFYTDEHHSKRCNKGDKHHGNAESSHDQHHNAGKDHYAHKAGKNSESASQYRDGNKGHKARNKYYGHGYRNEGDGSYSNGYGEYKINHAHQQTHHNRLEHYDPYENRHIEPRYWNSRV